MAKRFSETDKWKDAWFRKLKPLEKLVFLYLIDNCNNAGFMEIDAEFAAYQIGITEDEFLGAIQGLDRGCLGADGWVWIKNFLRHQKNDVLNPENNAHKQIISLFNEQINRFCDCQEFNEYLGANKGLFSPIGIGKGKGKGKGNSLASLEGGVGETKKRATVIPHDFAISDEIKSWAKKEGYTRLEERLSHFKDWAMSGSGGVKKYVDWDATFRNAIRGDYAKLNNNGNNGNGQKVPDSGIPDKDNVLKKIQDAKKRFAETGSYD